MEDDDLQLHVSARVVGANRRADLDTSLLIDDQRLTEVSFSDRKLDDLSVSRSRLERCKFERLRVNDASFGAGGSQSVYLDCSFDGSHIHAVAPGIARFERCSFRNVRLKDWFAFEVEFVDCVFTGRADKCVFNGTPRAGTVTRTHNDFYGNDFSGMLLRDAAFRTGIDLSRQKLPEGPEYLYLPDAQAAIDRARAAIAMWSDPGEACEAMIILDAEEKELRGGQVQTLIREHARRGKDPIWDKVIYTLRVVATSPTSLG